MSRNSVGIYMGLMLILGACSPKSASTVHLYGQLHDMGRQDVIMRYDGAASLLGDSQDIILHTDREGRFDTVLSLEKPVYYSICRNTLYLSPGDELEVKITQNNLEAEFRGQGAEANIYMKERLFPKGGSFLEGGSNVKTDFRQTREVIDSLAGLRERQLEGLQGVSAEFKALEKARIYADIINSYLYYASYAREYEGKNRDEINAAEQNHIETVLAEVKEMVEYLNDDRYLDVAVVRNILFYREDPSYGRYFEDYVLSPLGRELFEGYGKVAALRHDLTPGLVEELQIYTMNMQQKEFAREIENKLEQAARLLPGRPAPDFVMSDITGQQKKLSDFKGKILYLDLWATWCGPCIQESPAFAALSEKYPEILFLQISRDEHLGSWKNYLAHKSAVLPQYNSVDLNLVEGWQLYYIPRFILIDREQKIINAYAPRPSSEEIIPLLDSLVSK